MKNILLFIITALISNGTLAQSLSVSAVSSGSPNQFLVAGHQLTFSNGVPAFGSSSVSTNLNPLTAISAVISYDDISIFEANGNQLHTLSSFTPEGDDTSVKIYAKPNGGFIIRENIANFLFYNASGRIQYTISNSSQSSEGESISELAADAAFKTVVIYNPKIVRNGVSGSRARILNTNNTAQDIFYISDRAITLVKVSENGQFIAIVSNKSGSDDQVKITDRFGNEIVEISFDQDVADVQFSENGAYVTVRSNGRVGVYSTLSGEREGSTSFRSKLHFANYIPEDHTIIALTAQQNGSRLSEIELHAINIAERSIERQEFGNSLGTTDIIPVKLMRSGKGNYTLSGLSRTLNLNIR